MMPRRLRRGDRVAVIAPSGPVDPVRLARGTQVLGDLGLDVVLGTHVRDRHGYLAGSDQARAADLQDAWCDPAIAAVFCAKGGYGATRLLDFLDWEALERVSPKPLVGSSDITALHLGFAAKLGVPTCFGPMTACATISDDVPDPISLTHLTQTIFAGGRPAALSGRLLLPGQADGVLVGGTLALLAALTGTPYGLRADDAIVLLEDIREEPYRIDRMLTQLLQAGVLSRAAGFVLGSWPSCGEPAQVEAVLVERLAPLGVPVLADLPLGHGRPQLSVWLGQVCRVDTESCSMLPCFPSEETAPYVR